MNPVTREQAEAAAKPTKPGFYWAMWLTHEPDTHEGDELTPATNWEVVQVWENHIGTECEADKEMGIEKYRVSVPGVRESQTLDNFKWGMAVEHEAKLRDEIAAWTQLAKYQRDWFALNHPAGNNAGPCPTDAAIEQSETILGREIGHPPAVEELTPIDDGRLREFVRRCITIGGTNETDGQYRASIERLTAELRRILGGGQ